jgi:hypothetical protein
MTPARETLRRLERQTRSASFEPTADTNAILRRYATSYTIPDKRPSRPMVTAP